MRSIDQTGNLAIPIYTFLFTYLFRILTVELHIWVFVFESCYALNENTKMYLYPDKILLQTS